MSLASWFRLSWSHRTLALNKASRRQSRRCPARSRPALEHLEARTLLDGAGLVPGADTLASNFAPISIGQGIPTNQNFPNHSALTAEAYPNGVGEQGLDSTAAFLAQGQNSSQFRAFGVNSQGENNQLSQATVYMLRDAYGFGSGTQPNAPWAPAAYNLGLANHQFGYPSMSDLGFSATPPWFRPTAHTLPKEQLLDGDEEGELTSDSSLLHENVKDHEQDQQRWTDEDADEQNTEKAVLDEEKPVTEEQKVPERTAQQPTRGNPAVEAALFSDPLQTLAAAEQAKRPDATAPRLANAGHSPTDHETKMDGPAAEESRIPSSLWLSALAPAQMAALVVGRSGVEAPAEGGNTSSAAAE